MQGYLYDYYWNKHEELVKAYKKAIGGKKADKDAYARKFCAVLKKECWPGVVNAKSIYRVFEKAYLAAGDDVMVAED